MTLMNKETAIARHIPRSLSLLVCGLLICFCALTAAGQGIFNVRDYGATGKKGDDARPAIQKAIDECATAGGGTVYLPPGEYTSGQLFLRSHVRFYVEAGATIFVSTDPAAFSKSHFAALLSGVDLENISIEGRGVIDGQSSYEWRLSDLEDDYIRSNQVLMQSLGKPLLRPFPAGFPKETIYPRMVQLIRCRDVRITGLSFIRSRSWNIHPVYCERVVIDGIYIYSNLKEAVWADGIDPEGCSDLRLSNSTIETGDDAVVFYSTNIFGPALPCENITITNCRLSSASSALKFCDGNRNSIRKVTVDNCVITASNRGIAFMVFDGGYVSDVVLSNLVIETTLHDWFWWGEGDPIHFNIKRRKEISPGLPGEEDRPAGAIRNVIIRNVIARGQGTSMLNGHPESWLENISLENVKLFLTADPQSPMQKADHAISVHRARNLKLKEVQVIWDQPASDKWQSALFAEDVRGLELDGFSGQAARSELPAIALSQAEDVMIRNSTAREGTRVFLQVAGDKSRDIVLSGNDLRRAALPFRADGSVPGGAVRLMNNLTSIR